MKYFVFVLSAYLMGFVAAVPTGPVQIEVVRRAVGHHLKASLMVVLGAFFADVLYGAIAFFGIFPFLREKGVMALFWMGGGFLLSILGILTIRQGLRSPDANFDTGYLRRKRLAFLGGFSLSATNPMMVLWWLSGARLVRDAGLIEDFTSEIAISFLVAGSLGLASYLTALSVFIYWARKFIAEENLRRINVAFGLLLLAIALYFIVTSLRSLLT